MSISEVIHEPEKPDPKKPPKSAEEAFPPRSPDRPQRLLIVALTLVSALGLVGTTAAILGIFRPLIVLPLAAAVWAELYLLWDPGLRPARSARAPATRWWVAVGLLIAVLTVWNARLSAEHVLADRDPGIYLNTAAWLASEGNLVFEPRNGSFGSSKQIVDGGPGRDPTGEAGKYYFQFQHLLPVLQASGAWIGGDLGLTRVPALLGGLALFAFFGLATTLLRPWLAAVATSALGLNLAFVYTARDSYSEPLMLALLAGGLWLLLDAIDARSWRRVALAGIVFGTAALTRVDFSVYLIGVIVFLAIETIRLRQTEFANWWTRRALPAFAAGLTPGLLVGIADGLVRSRAYVAGQMHLLLPLLGFLVATAAVAVAVVVAWPYLQRLRTFVRPHQAKLAVAAALGIIALAAFAFAIRPEALVERDREFMGPRQATYEAIQRAEGVRVDPDRTYYERSMWWLSWYVGVPVLLAAVTGLSVVAARVVRGRAQRAEALLFLVVLTPLILTLARPSAFPDHPWVMRRFIPLAIPAVIVFAAFVAERVFASPRAASTSGRAMRLGAVALAAMTMGFPVAALVPVGGYHAYADFVDPIRSACQRIGPQGAVAVLPPLSTRLSLSFQSMCGIPAVGIRGQLSSHDARELANAFRAKNRRLWLVGTSGDSLSLSGTLPTLGVQSATGDRLRPTLTHRPDSLVPQRAGFVVGEVGNAALPSDFYGPEFLSDRAPWRWLASHPWLTVVSEGPTWLGFRAVSWRRPRTMTLETPSGTVLSADVTTRARTFLIGPLDIHTREDLEITTTPGPETGAKGDKRSLSVALTDPVVVNQPLAAFGVSGFWPAERDASGRSFNWIRPRATVQIVASSDTEQARLVVEASAPGGRLALTVRTAGAEIATLRLKPGFHRYVVDHVPLSQGRAIVDLIHTPTPDLVQGGDPRNLAVMVSNLEAASVSGR